MGRVSGDRVEHGLVRRLVVVVYAVSHLRTWRLQNIAADAAGNFTFLTRQISLKRLRCANLFGLIRMNWYGGHLFS